MKLSHLRDVLAVAELGSLRAAGRHIGIAQPAITRSIREIERELGASLFERHSKGVQLTAIGEAFVRRASIIESEMSHIREEIDHLRGRNTGQVSAALSVAPSIAILPKAVQAFRRRYPDALLRISETLFQPIERDLMEGRVDLYAGALKLPAQTSHFIVEKLFDNQRLVVARKGHALFAAKGIEALNSAQWLRPALSNRSSEADFVDLLRSLGLSHPKIVVHTRSALQTALVITSTDLVTVIPRQWLEMPVIGDLLYALPFLKPIEAAPVCLVVRNGVPLTPIAEHFCDIIRRVSGTYGRAHPLGMDDTWASDGNMGLGATPEPMPSAETYKVKGSAEPPGHVRLS